jgi:hypothetical protein
LIYSFIFLAALQSATPEKVAAVATPVAQTKTETPVKQKTPEKRICKTWTVTGSRLLKEKFCLTHREWREVETESRASLLTIQDMGS